MTNLLDPAEFRRRCRLVAEENDGILPYTEVFYLHSIEYSARAAVSAFMAYGELLAERTSDVEPVAAVHEALGHCAALSRFFWPARKDALALARASKLRKAFKIADSSPLRDRRLRNALEHFDEKLDQFLIERTVGQFFPDAMLGHHEVADNPIANIFKMVDPDNDIFVILNETFHFAPISKEVAQILVAIDRNSGRLPVP